MEQSRFIQLLRQWKNGNILPSDHEELSAYIQSDENREDILDILSWYGLEASRFPTYDQNRFDPILQKILAADKGGKLVEMPVRRIRSLGPKLAIAAVVLFIMSSIWLIVIKQRTIDNNRNSVAKTKDIEAPGNSKAIITLADGRQIPLDSVVTGTLAVQGNVNLVKTVGGSIAYQSGPLANRHLPLTYNILTNPRGSKVADVTLADGSRVWLNAGSSLRYPVAFVGNEREVEITGEAYFEVAHDARLPFIVKKGDVNVRVLGTHFNVNAYDDEDALRITLLEGSVNVSNSIGSVKIKPGEQATLTPNSKPQTQNVVDLDQVMAWKKGYFSFNNVDIQTVMRQIARWYDIDVVYQSTPSKLFKGGLPRDLSATKVFEVLEETGGVHFIVEGRKVIVIQ